MRSWTPPVEHDLLWRDDGGVCCCCGGGGGGDGGGRGGGEGGGRAGREGREAPNSSMYPGSNSLRREAENQDGEKFLHHACMCCLCVVSLYTDLDLNECRKYLPYANNVNYSTPNAEDSLIVQNSHKTL